MGSRTTKKLLSSDELILDGKSLNFFSTQRTGGTLVADTTPSVVTTNLVVHLDAGDTDSYPGSGTTWSDLTTTNADASLQNGAFYNNVYGGFIVFDGTNDYAQIPSTSWSVGNIFNGSNNFTISLWVNINSFPTNTNYIYSPVLFAPAEGHAYITLGDGIPTNEIGLRVYMNSAWTTPVSSNTLSTNTWYNICATYDSSSGFVFYQNGSSVDTDSTTATIGSQSSSNTLIGGSTAANQYRYLNGSIASLLIYDRAITAAEVTQNYNAIKSRYEDNSTIITTNLVFHLDAGNTSSYGGSGTTWSDLSTNSNNATLTGPTFNGGYFDFDGSNDHAVSASDMFDPNSNFTFSAWVNTDSTITGTMVSDFTYQGSLQIRFVSDGTVQIVDSYVVNVGTFTNFTYSTDTWYNVVVTRSSNTYSLYINGVYKSDFTSTNSYSYGPQSIGTNYNGYERWDGKISQIACYDTALSATQVQQNFDALKNRYGL